MAVHELFVLVKHPGGVSRTHRLELVRDASVQIGSSSACKIRIPTAGIAAVHVDVFADDDGVWLSYRSDGSTTIVLASSAPLQIRPGLWRLALPSDETTAIVLEPAHIGIDLACRLAAGRKSARDLGSHSESVSARRIAAQPASSPKVMTDVVPEEAGPGGARLDVTLVAKGYRDEFSFPVGSTVTLGRTRMCDVRVPDDIEGVSRAHAKLQWCNGWLVLDDLGSTNGTWVNNQRVKRMLLRAPTTEIELGRPGATVSVRVVGETRTFGGAASISPQTVVAARRPTVESPGVPLSAADEHERRLRERIAEQERELERKQHALLELEAKHVEHERRRAEQERLLRELEQRRIELETHLVSENRLAQLHAAPNERAVGLSRSSDFTHEASTDPTMPVFLVDEFEGGTSGSFETVRDTTRVPLDPLEQPSFVSEVVARVSGEIGWLACIPMPDQSVFRHLASHRSINELEATKLLGSPREFRRFSAQFESYLDRCPFRVRIETSGGLKCYVRTD